MIDYYQVLGVPLDASQALLRRAYLDQASNYHPFKKDNSQNSFDNFRKDSGINQTRFKLIAQAYTILGNDYWRRIYDSIALPKNSEENFNQSKTLYREDHHSRQNRESSSLPSEIACELVDLDPIKIFNRACAQQDEDRRQGRLDSSLISEFSRNKIFSPSSSSSSSSISSVSSSSRPSAISSSTNNSHGALVSKLKVPHSQLLPKDGLCNKTESNSGSSSDQRFNKPKSRKVSFSDQTIASDEIRMAREAVKAIKAEQSRNSALKVKQLEHIVPLENQTDTATILISENISRSRAHSMTDQISKLSLMERPEGDDVGEYQPLVQTSQNSERRRGAIMKNLASNRTTNPYNDNLDLHYQSAVYDTQARTSRELVDLDEQEHMKVNHTRNSEEIRMMNQIKTRPSVNRYRSGSSPTLPIRNDQKYALLLPNSSKSPEISARLSLKSFENFQTLQSDKPSDPSFSKDQQQY
ncbi:expressed protein [Phakopsora pachyrhizi]|uniref:Expressed protein n=1 Tax=Phakopsora pachyrhizi TaxID=170000 RepID=A0AAV0B1W6_PHAPC|nr:expressed protein [Phakopsora pachyrhizi]